VGLDSGLQGFFFSQCESEPCECLGLLSRPADEKIRVNVSLRDLKSLNKHFGRFQTPTSVDSFSNQILNVACLAGHCSFQD